MERIKLDRDIQPLSEFRANLAYYFDKVKKSKRPLIITQNGKSSAILIDVSEYEKLIEKLEILEDIKIAEKQIEEGKVISHREVKQRLSQGFKK